MLFLNLKTSPWYLILATSSFALVSLFSCGLNFSLQLALSFLIVAIAACSYYRLYKNHVTSIQFLTNDTNCLLKQRSGQLHYATLQANSYKSRYIIFLNWRLLFNRKSLTTMLCRWHYDAETWRQWHALINRRSFTHEEK